MTEIVCSYRETTSSGERCEVSMGLRDRRSITNSLPIVFSHALVTSSAAATVAVAAAAVAAVDGMCIKPSHRHRRVACADRLARTSLESATAAA